MWRLGVAELLIADLQNDCAEWPTSDNVFSPQEYEWPVASVRDRFTRLAGLPPRLLKLNFNYARRIGELRV